MAGTTRPISLLNPFMWPTESTFVEQNWSDHSESQTTQTSRPTPPCSREEELIPTAVPLGAAVRCRELL
jgi:hypothetical protein